MNKNFNTFLTEARKNPSVNPKETVYDSLKRYAKDDSYFISFTEIDKLGINPVTDHPDTPMGIYAYPLQQTWKMYSVDSLKDFKAYPYAAFMPYVWLFKPKTPSKILNLDTYKNSDYEEDLGKIETFLYKQEDFDMDVIFELFAYYEQYESNPAKKIWDLTHNIAIQLSKNNDKKTPLKWSSVFLAIDYQGVTDSNGIIFHQEPVQAVFFNSKFIEVKDRFIKDTRVLNKNG